MKGFALSATFAMGKFALRGLAQSMARELSPKGIDVAHFVIDGGIRSAARPVPADKPDSLLDPDAIAETYWHVLHAASQRLELGGRGAAVGREVLERGFVLLILRRRKTTTPPHLNGEERNSLPLHSNGEVPEGAVGSHLQCSMVAMGSRRSDAQAAATISISTNNRRPVSARRSPSSAP